MLISPLNTIFIHIPKCAGQSIELYFLEHLGLSWSQRDQLLCRPNNDPSAGPPRLAHLTAGEYVEFGYVPQPLFNRMYKFAFVRNPLARLVSEYRFRQHTIGNDFKTWVMRDFPRPGWSDQWRHVMPQIDYLVNDEGRLLVDFVGRFERLDEDFGTIRNELELPNPKLPDKNRNSKIKLLYKKIRKRGLFPAFKSELTDMTKRNTDYRAYYDQESFEWTRHFYKRDIERFGYDFDTWY